jgi:hypothetical protein
MSNHLQKIIEHHTAALDHAQQAVQHASECGRLLAQIKAPMDTLEFQQWVGENCPFKWRTAYDYIRIYKLKLAKPDENYTSVRQALGQTQGKGNKVNRLRQALYTMAWEIANARNPRAVAASLLVALGKGEMTKGVTPKQVERIKRILDLTPAGE